MRKMFSENQIKAIAQESGGAKLYKHELVIRNTSDQELSGFIMINTSPNSYEDGDPVIDYLDDLINFSYLSCDVLVSNDDNFYYLDSGTLTALNLSTIVSDEVTPL